MSPTHSSASTLLDDRPDRPEDSASRKRVVERLREALRRRGLLGKEALEPSEDQPLAPETILSLLSKGSLGAITGRWSSGKTTLALTAVVAATRAGKRAAVVDGTGWIFPPALALMGGDLGRILFLRASGRKAVWATEQVLRSGAFQVVALVEPGRLDRPAMRRLQIAAERSGSIGLVVRQVEPPPGLATVRMSAEPLAPVRGKEPSPHGLSCIAAPPRRCRVQTNRRGDGQVDRATEVTVAGDRPPRAGATS